MIPASPFASAVRQLGLRRPNNPRLTLSPLTTKILIAEPIDFSPAALRVLSTVGDVELRTCGGDALTQAFREYDAIWVRLANRIDERLLPVEVRCRILAVPTTGLDHIDLAACRRRGIDLLSLRGEVDFLKNIRATAELTLAVTFSLLRHLDSAALSVKQGQWNRDRFRGHELFGKTVGLVGVGRLGTLTAGYFRAFGSRVIGFDPRPDFPIDAAERTATLEEMLAQADIVSIHASYDESTRGLLGGEAFAAMKPGAMLINTSRGGIVDEPALLDALSSGRLAGAALDVLDGEPGITAAHPLVRYAMTHDNLLIVPHIGGNTYESFAATELFLAEKLANRLREMFTASIDQQSGTTQSKPMGQS